MNRSTLSILAFCFLLPGQSACSRDTWLVPANWQEIGNPEMFTCQIPVELQKLPGHSFDSFAELYNGAGIELVFDYGPYCRKLPKEEMGFRLSTEDIGGKQATIAIRDVPLRHRASSGGEFYYTTMVLFKDVGKSENKLFLMISYSTPDDIETALMIIRSITFPRVQELSSTRGAEGPLKQNPNSIR